MQKNGSNKTKKFGVERYIHDYRVVEYTNARGKVRRKAEYIGMWYVPLISEKEQRTMHIIFIAGVILLSLSLGAALVLPYAADSELYVVLPCAIALLPAFYMVMALFAQPKIGAKMERMHYEHAYLRIGRSAIAILIFVGVGFIGTVVYDILCMNHRVEKHLTGYDVLFLVLLGVVLALSVVLFFTVRRMDISIIENEKKAEEIRENTLS